MKKKVVITNSLYFPHIIGGAEISTQILAETLNNLYDVTVITVGPQDSKVGIIKDYINDIRVFRLPYNNTYWLYDRKNKSTFNKGLWHFNNILNIKQYRDIKKILMEIQPDLVHTQNLPGISFSIWKASKKLGIPVVHTLRDYSLIEPTQWDFYIKVFDKFTSHYSKNIDAVIGISNFVLSKHTEKNYFLNSKKYIIPNAVQYEDDFDNHKTVTKGPLTIGYFGRVDKHKGLQYLLEAVKNTPEEIITHFNIYGSGDFEEEVMEIAKTDKRIHYLGKVSSGEVKKAMANVDLTIVPSIWGEPFGRVIIESYQVGTPVFAAIDGGIPEVVLEPEFFLFEPKSSEAIKKSIVSYYNLSVEEKMDLTKRCINYSKTFNTDKLLKEHIKVYDDIFNQRI